MFENANKTNRKSSTSNKVEVFQNAARMTYHYCKELSARVFAPKAFLNGFDNIFS